MVTDKPTGASGPTARLSALLVVHNEEAQLADCLGCLGFADEIVVVLDKCTDRSREIAAGFGARLVEGAWSREGDRRNLGIESCRSDWILEIDADERVPAATAAAIHAAIGAAPPGYFLVPYRNFVGGRPIRYGWGAYNGVAQKPSLFSRGAKRWGPQRVHPAVSLSGERQQLAAAIDHYVDRDLHDMMARLNNYSTLAALDLVEAGAAPRLAAALRRVPSRFWKSFVARRGYREGPWGLALGLFSALYPLLTYLKVVTHQQSRRPPDEAPVTLEN
jgi:glycosyltransferase involved in cell wall biosynthesis